jgi:hypothetical protein
MKTGLAIAAVCMLAPLTSLVLGQDQKSLPLPPGVQAGNWIPIGERVGFVVTPAPARHDPRVLTGYFMARHGNDWKRLQK